MSPTQLKVGRKLGRCSACNEKVYEGGPDGAQLEQTGKPRIPRVHRHSPGVKFTVRPEVRDDWDGDWRGWMDHARRMGAW